MKEVLLDFLICPRCLPEEYSLSCSISKSHNSDILSGTLGCLRCDAVYPIKDGIAYLNPSPPGRNHHNKYEEPGLVSSYLWSHYSDIFGDEDASAAYREWAELIGTSHGISLDSGCAVGRFAFELSGKSDFSVGIDNSRAFVSKARELMNKRKMDFYLIEEGRIYKKVTIELPEDWNSDNVEFILGNAQALPFKMNLFSTLSSLNLIDKIPLPLNHLKEVSRVGKQRGAQFLFSDPFSWSPDTAREEEWLGGATEGPFIGRGFENVMSVLAGGMNFILPPWNIEKKGRVWWKIRHHCNHFELIRSCYVKASR